MRNRRLTIFPLAIILMTGCGDESSIATEMVAMTGTFSLISGLMNFLGVKVDRSQSLDAIIKYVGTSNEAMLQRIAEHFGKTLEEVQTKAQEVRDTYQEFVLKDADVQAISHVRDAIANVTADGRHRVILHAAEGTHYSVTRDEVIAHHTALAEQGTLIDILEHGNDGLWVLHTWDAASGSWRASDPLDYESAVQPYLQDAERQTTVCAGRWSR